MFPGIRAAKEGPMSNPRRLMRLLSLLTLVVMCGQGLATLRDAPAVIPPPAATQKAFALSPFYQKFLDANGLPIVSSRRVPDAALREAAWIVDRMLADRPDVRRALIHNRVRVAVMAASEKTTDVPEHSDLTPRDYWDGRARGLGATRVRPAVS
jgi:hypothetical protein